MDAIITPSTLEGSVRVPSSKSYAARALVCALFSEGWSRISPFSPSRDMDSLIRGIRALGGEFTLKNTDARVLGGGICAVDTSGRIFGCDLSATALRFLIPAAALSGGGLFRGEPSLLARPVIQPYAEAFEGKNISLQRKPGAIAVKGFLKPGEYRLRGDISSQFISGLMLALAALPERSEIIISTEIFSRPYIMMTAEVMQRFGAGLCLKESRFGAILIEGGGYKKTNYTLEGDYSQAAFFFAANYLGGSVECLGLNEYSNQGDRAVTDILARMDGADNLRIDLSQNPDLLPPLMVAAALREGRRTAFTNLSRTRIKESDRLFAIGNELRSLGAVIHTGPDFIIADGVKSLKGGAVSSHGDHRIAMALAIASCAARQTLLIHDAEAVGKSYPDFFTDFVNLGGKVQWL